ncbi:hypothetical protein AVEN_23086-1 [Araneus ventricosus]|uniref:Uncharacterized protein n=1 Tax=Araneus ventricosus TaxID=182803 RepID=A0A4Y2QVR3_ARAVE|nr:hypothetical protein AVEN_23086-1 [Araneus ventricosus]
MKTCQDDAQMPPPPPSVCENGGNLKMHNSTREYATASDDFRPLCFCLRELEMTLKENHPEKKDAYFQPVVDTDVSFTIDLHSKAFSVLEKDLVGTSIPGGFKRTFAGQFSDMRCFN